MIHGSAYRQCVLVIASMLVPTASVCSLTLADSINLTGYMEYQGRHITRQSEDSNIFNAATFQLNASTFLWRPWIGLLDGGLGLSLSSSQGSVSQAGQDINGNLNVRLFPRSRFPFRAFFERRQSKLDGDLSGSDRIRTHFGFTQSYSSTAGSRYSLRVQRNLSTEDIAGSSAAGPIDDVDDSINLTYSTRLGNNTFDMSTDYDRVVREKPDEKNTRLLHLIRHQYRPASNLSVNNLASYNVSQFKRESAVSTLDLLQLNSNTFWRPATEKPLLLTGSALMQLQGVDAGAGTVEAKNAVISGQGNYQWSPFLNLRAQASVSATDTGEDRRLLTLQRAGIDYSPAEKPLLGMQYNYTLAADVSNRTGQEEGAIQDISLNSGHTLSRSLPLAGGFLNFSASQRGAALFDITGKLDRTLTHTVTSGWSNSADGAATFIRLSLSDTRRFGTNKFGLQLANLQVSRNQQLSRDASWNGNITIQASKPLDDSDDSVLDINTSIDLGYTQQRLFGVPRLTFNSELRYLSNSLLTVIKSEGLDINDRNDSFWQNRLSYRIGRLEIRLRGNVDLSDSKFNTLVHLQIRRNFGR